MQQHRVGTAEVCTAVVAMNVRLAVLALLCLVAHERLEAGEVVATPQAAMFCSGSVGLWLGRRVAAAHGLVVVGDGQRSHGDVVSGRRERSTAECIIRPLLDTTLLRVASSTLSFPGPASFPLFGSCLFLLSSSPIVHLRGCAFLPGNRNISASESPRLGPGHVLSLLKT